MLDMLIIRKQNVLMQKKSENLIIHELMYPITKKDMDDVAAYKS